MKIQLIFPRWPKLPGQTPFSLPPLGMIQAAACIPSDVTVTTYDENVQDVFIEDDADLVGISTMLTCQAARAYHWARQVRSVGKPVVLGGLHISLCPDEAAAHADAIVIGEAEDTFADLVRDFQRGEMKPRYQPSQLPDLTDIPLPRRDLYDKQRHYSYKDWELVDLVETSRGCRFDCYPCCTPYLGGRVHRLKPMELVLEDIRRCADTLFIVDNSLEQSVEYEKTLFKAMAGLGKKWVSHPISANPEVLSLAKKAGCWYVYHAIYTISDKIRDRIKLYHDHGIGVEGTILLGLDDHDEDFIKRFIDFLLTVDLDLAEFTVLTPFPHTRAFDDLQAEGRIFDSNWEHYNAGTVVFRPRQMAPETLQRLFDEAWDLFYREESQELKMSRLILRMLRERSGRPRRRRLRAE